MNVRLDRRLGRIWFVVEQRLSNSVTSTYQNEAGFPVGAKLTNDGNLYIAQDVLGYTTPMSAEDQIKLAANDTD